MLNINTNIHPINATKRYAQMVTDGFKGAPTPIPVASGGGRLDNALYAGTRYATANPVPVAIGTFGGIVLNNMAGNPLGGAIDFLSLGLTNFKPDEEVERMTNVRLYSQPGMQQQASAMPSNYAVPELDEEQRKRQLQYLERKVATDLLTIEALQQQPGMGDIY